MESLKNKILDECKKGNIIVSDINGVRIIPLNTFVEQPISGILYDLNRTETTILKFISDPKWINDFAAMQVIMELKRRVNELELLKL